MEFLGGLFIIILAGIAADTIVKVVKARAGGRGTPQFTAELKELRRLLAEQAAALDDAQNALAAQQVQLQEVQERLDFTERILAQVREGPGLDAGG